MSEQVADGEPVLVPAVGPGVAFERRGLAGEKRPKLVEEVAIGKPEGIGALQRLRESDEAGRVLRREALGRTGFAAGVPVARDAPLADHGGVVAVRATERGDRGRTRAERRRII